MHDKGMRYLRIKISIYQGYMTRWGTVGQDITSLHGDRNLVYSGMMVADMSTTFRSDRRLSTARSNPSRSRVRLVYHDRVVYSVNHGVYNLPRGHPMLLISSIQEVHG